MKTRTNLVPMLALALTWDLTQHPTQQAIYSSVKIPAGTKLAARGFHLLGLATSGLVVPARAGDTTIHVRSTAGMSVGDTIDVDGETRKIANIGTAAGNTTTLWQPLPDGPVITIPAGATSVKVRNVNGFVVGDKLTVGNPANRETVTITANSPSRRTNDRARRRVVHLDTDSG